jgi:competence protein ComGF
MLVSGVIEAFTDPASLINMVIVSIHPLKSVTVARYEPADKLLSILPVVPDGHP